MKQIKPVFVSYADSIKQPNVKRIRFERTVEDIKKGKYKKIINTIRNTTNKEKRKRLKMVLLPFFTLSKFSNNYRKNKNFMYTRFMIFDIDNITSSKQRTLKFCMEKRAEVFCCFVSPSGNGLKVIYKLNKKITNVKEYRQIYKHQSELIAAKYKVNVDNTIDPARTCYVSYDPSLIYNSNCKTIDVDTLSKKVKNIFKNKLTKEDIDLSLLPRIINFLTGKIDYNEWITCGFALASLGEKGRAFFINLEINNPDYSQNEETANRKFDNLLSGYETNRTSINSIFKLAHKKGFVFDKYHTKTFWSYVDGRLVINFESYLSFLEERGFCKINLYGTYNLVHNVNNKLKLIDTIYVKDFILEYLQVTNNCDVREKLLKGINYYFNTKMFEGLKTKSFKFRRDTKELSYMYYNNCFVEISKLGVKEKDYSELKDEVIWEKCINKRNFVKNNKTSTFSSLLTNICNKDKKRRKALKSTIGYLLHTYKNPTVTKAIIFCDEKMDEGANGRSCKSLVGKAISHLRNMAEIDGRLHNFNTSFAYQEVNLDTQIINFNDAPKNFLFDKLFSSITDNLRLEKKNKDAVTIPFDSSPKFLISTNYVIPGEDESSMDRKFEIEFSDFYNIKHEPIQDFGKQFFNEWGEVEWNSFDLFMMKCLKLYLKRGLIPYKHVNLKMKLLINSTNREFAEYIKNINRKREHNVTELYHKFTTKYEEVDSWLKQNTFTKWINLYGKIYGYRIKYRYSSGNKLVKIIF